MERSTSLFFQFTIGFKFANICVLIYGNYRIIHTRDINGTFLICTRTLITKSIQVVINKDYTTLILEKGNNMTTDVTKTRFMINIVFGAEKDADEKIAVYELVNKAYPTHDTYSISYNTKNDDIVINYMTPGASKMNKIKLNLLELAKLAYKDKEVTEVVPGDLNQSAY